MIAIVPPACPYKDETNESSVAGTSGSVDNKSLRKSCFKGKPPMQDGEAKPYEGVGAHSGEALSILSLFDMETELRGVTINQNFASGQAAIILSERVKNAGKGKFEGKVNGKIDGKVEGKIEGKVDGKVDGKIEGTVNGQVSSNHTLPEDSMKASFASSVPPNRGPGGRFGRFGVPEPKAVIAFNNGQNYDEDKYLDYKVRLAAAKDGLNGINTPEAKAFKVAIESLEKQIKEMKLSYEAAAKEVKTIESSIKSFKGIFSEAKNDVTSLFTHLDKVDYKGFLVSLFDMFFAGIID